MTAPEKGLPSGIQLENQGFSFNQIHKRFEQTPYGEKLKANIRYVLYKSPEVPNYVWEKTLGIDVNNLAHLYLSLGLTKSFLSHCANPPKEWKGEVPNEAAFSPAEQELLLITSVVHDWGEAVIGDIPYALKKPSDEEREMKVLQNLIPEVLGQGESSEELASNVQAVLTNTNSKLG